MQQQRYKKSESFLQNVLFLAKKQQLLDIFQSSDLYTEKLRDKENFHKISKQAKGIRFRACLETGELNSAPY